ncbi:MAG: type II secretion system protein [Clostridia bacterium]
MLREKCKGITLVALVITIVILLILAGISISTLTNTGIFQKAKDAKGASENAEKEEKSLLSEYEQEIIKQDSNGIWDGSVNKPNLMTGMKAINFKFDETKEEYETNREDINTNNENKCWYDYESKKWANAQTEDGSMWVWIPRYAYKVVYNDPNDKSKGGKFDIVFLIGITDNYIDDNGNIQTAQRQTEKNQVIETDSTKTDKYTVHPAFTNESNIDYANGGWKEELTGIWVAKFEAGFVDKSIFKANKEKYFSSVYYTQNTGYTPVGKNEDARNYLNGIYGSNATKITYPTFQGDKYSMNYINQGDAFSISSALTEEHNIYGLKSGSTDSHLIKNSEWGAVAYLGQSKYGLNTENIRINNLNTNNGVEYVYAKTGYASKMSNDAGATDSIADVYKWTEERGIVASCTGTIYGIYDMSGGILERSAAIVNNGHDYLNIFGKSIMNSLNNGKSSAYVTVYDVSKLGDSGLNNWNVNVKYGDAICEISSGSEEKYSWNMDYSYFPTRGNPFFGRGGGYWDTSSAGLFYFGRNDGKAILLMDFAQY